MRARRRQQRLTRMTRVPWIFADICLEIGKERVYLKVLRCGDLGMKNGASVETLVCAIEFQEAVAQWVRNSGAFYRRLSTQLLVGVPGSAYELALWPRTLSVVFRRGVAELAHYWSVRRGGEDVTIPRTVRAVEAFAAFQRYMSTVIVPSIGNLGVATAVFLDCVVELRQRIDVFAREEEAVRDPLERGTLLRAASGA